MLLSRTIFRTGGNATTALKPLLSNNINVNSSIGKTSLATGTGLKAIASWNLNSFATQREARPAGAAREVNAPIRVHLSSPGIIADPYIPPAEMPSILSVAGWKGRYEKWRAAFVAAVSLGRIKRKLPTFAQGEFKQEAEDMYVQMTAGFAKGDKSVLRTLVTEKVYTEMKSALKRRRPGETQMWKLVSMDAVTIQHMRAFALNKKDNEWAQVTIKFSSQQTLAVYDKAKRLTMGHPSRPRSITEYVVFERPLDSPFATWRVCGRLLAPKSNVEAKKTQ